MTEHNRPNVLATRLLKKKTYNHPKEYKGYPFLSVIKTNQRVGITRVTAIRLGIIYGSEGKSAANMEINFLDVECIKHSGLDEQQLILTINKWYNTKDRIPLNVFLALEGYHDISSLLQKIRYADIDRIIGTFFTTNYSVISRRKRSRKKILKEQL